MDVAVYTSLASLVALAASLLGIYLSMSGHRRSQRGENRSEDRESGAILTEIGYIRSGIDDIKREQREQARTNLELFTRLSAVETLSRQAHQSINEPKGM